MAAFLPEHEASSNELLNTFKDSDGDFEGFDIDDQLDNDDVEAVFRNNAEEFIENWVEGDREGDILDDGFSSLPGLRPNFVSSNSPEPADFLELFVK